MRSVRRRMSPAAGSSSPVIRRSRVVLPEPLAPRMAIRSGPRTSNDSGPNRRRSPNAITTSLKATSSRPPGSAVRGRSIASGVSISTCARASSSASVRSPIRRSASWLSRAALFSARCFSRSMNILSSTALGAPGAAGLVAARFFLLSPFAPRARCCAARRRRGRGRPRRGRGRRRALRQRPATPPPKTVMPTGVSSTMRSTRSSSARSWLATSTPPCQRASNSATASRPSASRLLVGSSSSSRSGASISRRASATRVRSPPLSEAIGRCSDSAGRPVSTSAASIRVSSVQSASVGVIQRTVAAFEPAQTGEIAGDAQRLGDRQAVRRSVARACRSSRCAEPIRLPVRSRPRSGAAAWICRSRCGRQGRSARARAQASVRRTAGVRQAWRGRWNPERERRAWRASEHGRRSRGAVSFAMSISLSGISLQFRRVLPPPLRGTGID